MNKPKIAFLATSCAGTGGGRMIAQLSTLLFEEGYDIKLHLQSGIASGMGSLVKCPVGDLTDIKGDIIVCFDTGVKHGVGDVFLDTKGKKIFYLILWHPEYKDVLADSSIMKLGMSTWLARKVGGRPIIGPADTKHFYPPPPDMIRAPIVLFYLKKAGWVGVEATRIAKDYFPELILASLGMDGLNPTAIEAGFMIKPKHQILNLGFPAQCLSELRAIYSKSEMFLVCDGAWGWGANFCIFEAMLCGCPVISTDWEGFSDTIIAEETALTVNGRCATEVCGGKDYMRPHPAHIVERILRLHGDSELRARLAKNAYKRVSQYDHQYWLKSFKDVISNV